MRQSIQSIAGSIRRPLVALALALAAVHCAPSSATEIRPDTPSLVLERYLSATLNFRFEEAFQHLSSRDRRGLTVEEYARRGRQMNALIVLLSQETQWRIVAERNSGDVSEVEVEMTSPNFENLEVFEKELRSRPELKAEKNYEAEIQKELIRAVKAGIVPKTTELHRYRLVYEEDAWKVTFKG